MRPRTFAIVVVALLILASGGVVWSQTVQGVITGTIMDPTGAVVPNATVIITNVGTNISQATTTGSDGSYRFARSEEHTSELQSRLHLVCRLPLAKKKIPHLDSL